MRYEPTQKTPAHLSRVGRGDIGRAQAGAAKRGRGVGEGGEVRRWRAPAVVGTLPFHQPCTRERGTHETRRHRNHAGHGLGAQKRAGDGHAHDSAFVSEPLDAIVAGRSSVATLCADVGPSARAGTENTRNVRACGIVDTSVEPRSAALTLKSIIEGSPMLHLANCRRRGDAQLGPKVGPVIAQFRSRDLSFSSSLNLQAPINRYWPVSSSPSAQRRGTDASCFSQFGLGTTFACKVVDQLHERASLAPR